MAQPTVGVYRLCSTLNTDYVIDVYGASTSTNAKVQLYGNNDTSAQKFLLTKGYQDNDSYRRMQFQCSAKCAYAPKGESPTDNTLVRQYPPSGTDDLDWSFTQDTSFTCMINGVDYYPYEIAFRYVKTLRLDDAGARITANNDIVTYTDNDTDAQRWILVKDSYKKDDWKIPGISLLGCVGSGQVDAVPLNTTRSRTLKLTNSSTFQYRYCWRTLPHNSSEWIYAEGSNWRSPSGAITDEGWGDAWSSNATQTNTINFSGANTTDKVDAIEYHIEARTFGTSSGQVAHSASNTIVMRVYQLPSIEITDVSITADGMTIAYTTDCYRTLGNGVNIKVSPIYQNKSVLFSGGTFHKSDSSSGNINIPFEQLEYMPAQGSSVKITMFFDQQTYIHSTTVTEELTITYSGGDLTPVISLTQLNDYTVEFSLSEQDGKTYNVESASFIYEHDGKAVIHKMTKGDDGTYKLATPLNKKYHLFVMLANKSGETYTSWGAKYQEYISPECKAVVINTENTEVEFEVFEMGSNFITKDKEVTTETAKLEGYQFETVYYSSVQSSKLSISGLGFSEEDKPLIESALNDGYCLLRDFRGLYCFCAISNINYTPVNKNYTTAQVDFIEIQNEIDYALPY